MKKLCALAFLSFSALLYAQQIVNIAEGQGGNELLLISGGTFTMGSGANERTRSDNEGPQRQVTISSFYIGKYPVTQAEFEDVMGINPSEFKGASLPVERVSWFDAVEFANRLSVKSGLTPAYTISGNTVTWNREANGYRLPTEAEWEFASRAGTVTPFYSGTSMQGAGWHSGNSGGQTHPVGQLQPNAWGLYDMHGNVLEWCWDWYGDYTAAAQTNPQGPSSGVRRVYRGGSWRWEEHQGRSAFRFGNQPNLRLNFIGFRLARSADGASPLVLNSSAD